VHDRFVTSVGPLVTGHRGARGVQPENSIPAFEYAAAIGCDGVELDVHLSADGVPVVIHDDLIDPGDGILRRIGDLSLSEIRERTGPGGEAIPTLPEVLDLLDDRGLYVQIELKGEGTEAPCAAIVQQREYERRTVFTSFVHERVLTVKQFLPSVRTGILLSSVPVRILEVAHWAYADNIHLDHRRITRELVETIHRAGKFVVAWGIIGDASTIDRLLDLGVDMIGSDWPARVLERRAARWET